MRVDTATRDAYQSPPCERCGAVTTAVWQKDTRMSDREPMWLLTGVVCARDDCA